MAKLVLKKPVFIDDEETKEIEYDFNNLMGDAGFNAIKDLGKRGVIVQIVETEPLYLAHLFSQAAGLEFEDVMRFGIKDFNNVVSVARDFLLEDGEE